MKRFTSSVFNNRSIRYYMAVKKFYLPDLGEKIKEGNIKALYVKEGSHVLEFTKVADVESDKQFT